MSLGARLSAGELPAKTSEAIDAAVAQFMEKQRVPGLSLAIEVDGQIVRERGYGLADVENHVPATPQSVYRLASISKMLTAVAVMQLEEKSKLDLSAPIQQYVSDFPEKQAPITAELLLKHQSGIRHYKGEAEVASAVAYRRVGDALVIFKDDPLLFTPGEKFSYTTYGYNLLGAAIEGASGQDYVSYVQEHVCRPAGMTSIQPDEQARIIPHRAAGYRLRIADDDKVTAVGEIADHEPAKGELVNGIMVDVSNKIPGGGWCSTAGDLARFAIALANGKLVSKPTLEKMWTVQKTASGEATPSGLGCFVDDVGGERRISHSGGQSKVATFLTLSPEKGRAIALMCNLQGAKLKPLAAAIYDLLEDVSAERR